MANDPEIELRELLSAAEILRPRLENHFLASPIFLQPSIRLTSRIKSISRATAKLAQIRIEREDAPPTEISDLLGLRVVALYNSNLIEALETVLEAIKKGVPDPFTPDPLGMLIYTSRPEKDPLSLRHQVEGWAKAQGLDPKIEMMNTLYSSVHINAACPVVVEKATGEKIPKIMRVEIQVRTAMEDVWSQLSHGSAYTHHQAKPSILGHLNALKQVFDGCAIYIDLIKSEAESSIQGIKEGSDAPKSAGDQPLKQIKGLPNELLAAFDAAIRQRNAATLLDDPHAFLEAAKRFESIEKQFRAIKLPPQDKSEAIYRTQMERAFCLLFSYTIPGLDDAYAMYDSLAKADTSDAVCRLRLAQALRRKGENHRAKETLLEATKILDQDQDPRVDAGNWVRGRVHEELAIANWLIYNATSDDAEKSSSLSQAITEARKSIEKYKVTTRDEIDLMGAINNLLYFDWEHIRVYKKPIIPNEQLASFVDALSPTKIRALLPAHKWDAFLDTSLKISMFLDRDNETLLEITTAIMDAIDDKVRRRTGKEPDYMQRQKALTADEMDTYLHAVDVAARKSTKKH